MGHQFDTKEAERERNVDFGEITEVSPFRWAFRVGVTCRRGESYNEATARVLMGKHSIDSHPDGNSMRIHRDAAMGWVGASSNDKEALERVLEHIGPLTTGRMTPAPLAMRMMVGLR